MPSVTLALCTSLRSLTSYHECSLEIQANGRRTGPQAAVPTAPKAMLRFAKRTQSLTVEVRVGHGPVQMASLDHQYRA